MNSPSSYQLQLAEYLKSGLSPKTIKKIEAMPDVMETGRFLYNAGYHNALLQFSLNNLKKKKKVPWPFVMKVLTNHNIIPPKEISTILLKSLLPKDKSGHHYFSACGEWAEFSSEFRTLLQSLQEASQNHPHTLESTDRKDTKPNFNKHSKQTDRNLTPPEIETGLNTAEMIKPLSSIFSPESSDTSSQESLLSDPKKHLRQTDSGLRPTESEIQQDSKLDLNKHLKQTDNSFPITEPAIRADTMPDLSKHPKQTNSFPSYTKEKIQLDVISDPEEQRLLKQLEFVQAKDLVEEEKKIVDALLKSNPEKYSQLNKELKMKKALQFLQKQKLNPHREKSSYWILPHTLSGKENPCKTQICEETFRLAEKHPEKAKHLAIFLYTLGWTDQSIKILGKTIQSTSEYWFYLNWLMEIKQYAVTLDITNQLLIKLKSDSEALFPITYIKAQALYALGEKDKAISYMSDLVKVRPEYKSARHFLEEWTKI